ncbi:MAG TPA: hypothetical protein VHT75_11195 [Acidimicrobiales bacterium]|nr:hypothetical protein [Acidimicrobiales bacterium]
MPAPAPPPDDGYRNLSVSDVLADLPSLERDQLLLVKALEEAGERRPVILDRLGDLLVIKSSGRHLTVVPSAASVDSPPTSPAPPAAAPSEARAPAPPTPTAPADPAPPARRVARRTAAPIPQPTTAPSEAASEVVDQMGELLAKGAARRAGAVSPAAPAGPATPPAPSPTSELPPTMGAKGKRAGRRKTGPPVANGLIVPTDGRRSKGRRHPQLRVALLIAVLLAGGGAAYWKISQKASSPPAGTARPGRDLVAELLVKAVPAGYAPQPDTTGANGAVDLAHAVAADRGSDAAAFLGQAGFLHGYQRSWTGPDHQKLVVVIYHFRTAAGAASFAARSVATATATVKPAPAPFAVSGVPAAAGLTGTIGADHVSSVTFGRGRYAVSVSSSGPVATGQAATVTQVAAAQFALLPAT